MTGSNLGHLRVSGSSHASLLGNPAAVEPLSYHSSVYHTAPAWVRDNSYWCPPSPVSRLPVAFFPCREPRENKRDVSCPFYGAPTGF